MSGRVRRDGTLLKFEIAGENKFAPNAARLADLVVFCSVVILRSLRRVFSERL